MGVTLLVLLMQDALAQRNVSSFELCGSGKAGEEAGIRKELVV